MPIERLGDLLNPAARSLGFVHFEERFKNSELLDGLLPLSLWDGHEIGSISNVLVNSMIRLPLTNGMRSSLRLPTSRAIIASNPMQSTTTKRRFRQRMVFPGVKATETAITFSRVREV
jgi:hypothetical protein